MLLIALKTRIEAPTIRCFDLARNTDVHLVTAPESQEKAIDGRTTGLIELGESVTSKDGWRSSTVL